jgi:ferritin-like metal-binding protein YciE
MKLESLADVFEAELKDLYSAEKQLVEALPSIASAASSKDLATAVESHLDETRGHVKRLEQVFDSVGLKPESEHCDGMEGLIKEGSEVAEADGDGDARDAALIGAAQRVEHYEIAAYGTARTLADELGLSDATDLLDQTLDEESNADTLLTKIATGGLMKSGINQQAQR